MIPRDITGAHKDKDPLKGSFCKRHILRRKSFLPYGHIAAAQRYFLTQLFARSLQFGDPLVKQPHLFGQQPRPFPPGRLSLLTEGDIFHKNLYGNACVPHTFYELYPANVRISVTAQPRACARNLRYQPDPFVVAEGLYGEPCFLAYFGNVYFFHLRNAALSFIFLRPPRHRPER